jgi:hypothetical protein
MFATILTISRFHKGDTTAGCINLPPARNRLEPMQIGRYLSPLRRLALPLQWPGRLAGRLSVRSRIVVLALIPVIGFLANGITYLSGKAEVGHSFATVNRSRELADASRDFKISVAAMRIAAKDFTVSPHGTLVDTFLQSQ